MLRGRGTFRAAHDVARGRMEWVKARKGNDYTLVFDFKGLSNYLWEIRARDLWEAVMAGAVPSINITRIILRSIEPDGTTIVRFSLADDNRTQLKALEKWLKSCRHVTAALIAAGSRLTVRWDSIVKKTCAILHTTREGYAAIQESYEKMGAVRGFPLGIQLESGLRRVLGEGIDIKIVPDNRTERENEPGLNNCFFESETCREHDGLRFRSPAEVAIYDELRGRKVLFFPNAAAVLGGEKSLKREPDFLICDKGKWGVLEVMGETYHTHANAVKDHDRARLFKEHGLLCHEFYSAQCCMSDPKGVVDAFLSILAKHR
jgi:hypothetical protein